VHADGIGDVAQNERSQRLDAAPKKGVLLTDDFSCDFENCGRSLVQ
jgi:hypothetical protein